MVHVVAESAPKNSAFDPDDEWISFSAAARILNLSTEAVRRMTRRGLLPVLRIPGSHPRVRRADVVALVERSITITTAKTDGFRPS